MHKVIKLPTNKKIYFVSDLHINQDKVFVYGERGFSTGEEHDEYIYESLKRISGPDSILVNLGDSCFRDNDMWNFKRLAAIPFYKHYHIWGNHPSGAKQAYKNEINRIYGRSDIEVYPLVYDNVTFLPPIQNFAWGDQFIVASHFPLSIWDHSKDEAWHLNGHCHGGFSETRGNCGFGKTLDVGVDTALQYNNEPFWTIGAIKVLMDHSDIFKRDGHH